MVSVLPFRILAGAALLASVPAQLLAATPPTQSKGKASLIRPLTLQKLEDMEFGTLAVAASGTAVINPVSNTMSTTGGVVAAGGTPHAAHFRGAAAGGPVVNLKVPNGPVTLTRVGGTQTLTLSNFTLDGPSKRVMGASPFFEFRVGGKLTIPANPVSGDYVGTFTVTAQYP